MYSLTFLFSGLSAGAVQERVISPLFGPEVAERSLIAEGGRMSWVVVEVEVASCTGTV